MQYPTLVDVFEHGILIIDGEPLSGLARLATTREPIYSHHKLALLDRDGSSLTHRTVHLARPQAAYRNRDFWDETDVRYCLLSSQYHLSRIIGLYVEKCQLFEEHHPAGTALSGNTDDPRIYYEVDAFLGAARRVYEAIRKVLWKHYGGPKNVGGMWSSIRTVMRDQSGAVPAGFFALLQESWSTHGEKLRDYRDCISHYYPLTDHAVCWMHWYGNRWGATVPLPSNPETHSRKAFDNAGEPIPGNSIDALGYCYGIAAHLVGLCEALMALPEIASHIANPPKLT